MKKLISTLLVFTILASCLMLPITVSAATEMYSFSLKNGTAGSVLDSDYGDEDGYYLNSNVGLSGIIYGSANTTKTREFVWTDVAYSDGAASYTVPCMEAGKNNLWARGANFVMEISTKGYENIKFSAKMGGSNKAPRDYVLQYSTNGTSYVSVTSNASLNTKEVMKQMFNEVSLPSACNNKDKLYIRIMNSTLYMVNGSTGFVGTSSGRVAINDIVITGDSTSSQLNTPYSSAPNGDVLCSDDLVTLTSPDSAALKFKVNDGEWQNYTAPFSPFDYVAYGTQTATVSFYATQSGKTDSEIVANTYTWSGDNIARFQYDAQPYSLGGVIEATSGSYPRSKMTASANGTAMYVPLFNNEKGNAVSISPDDGILYGENGYWQFEVSTSGYENIKFNIDAASTKKGPKSYTLSYSKDGKNYTTLETNKAVPTDSVTSYYGAYPLPADAANCEKLYIRLSMTENKRADATDSNPLFNYESRGNALINDVIITGTVTGTPMKPYADKASDKFSADGTLEYISPSQDTMKYNIYDKNGNKIVDNATYNAPIALGSMADFVATENNAYTVEIWSEDNGAKSVADVATYTYKGEIITAFDYEEVASNATQLNATTGTGTIKMYPNAKTAAKFEYNKDSIYVRSDVSNYWTYSKTGVIANDGYWLIQTSTKGYKNLSFSAKQISTSKGPRDYSLMYSTDGTTFTPVPNSFIRVADDLKKSYTNISLPAELNDRDTVYFKIKISGSQNVDGFDLDGTQEDGSIDTEVLGDGNTGINNIELCGIPVGAEDASISIVDSSISVDYGISYTVTAATADCVIIVAGYDANDMLTYIDILDENMTFTVPASSEATALKVMMLDELGNIRPLTEDIVRSIK